MRESATDLRRGEEGKEGVVWGRVEMEGEGRSKGKEGKEKRVGQGRDVEAFRAYRKIQMLRCANRLI